MPHVEEKRIHSLFEISIILKGLNALVELLLGALFLFVNVGDIVRALVENELLEDPQDFLASHLQPYASHLSASTETYLALYLLSHGFIKGFLVAGLLRDKMWAYPSAIAVLSLFAIYQIIKLIEIPSLALFLFTIFDVLVIWLVYHEYRLKQRL